MSDNFYRSLTTGSTGEHAVWNYLIKRKTVRSVVDVRDDKTFQEFDVDFLVENTDRQFAWVEIKTDLQAYDTGNIAYEYSTSGHIGCLEKTKADLLIYYVPQAHIAYAIGMELLRRFVKKYNPKTINMGDAAKGYLIKIADLKKEKVILDTYEGIV